MVPHSGAGRQYLALTGQGNRIIPVIPAKAGIQQCCLDSGFRRSDGLSIELPEKERYGPKADG